MTLTFVLMSGANPSVSQTYEAKHSCCVISFSRIRANVITQEGNYGCHLSIPLTSNIYIIYLLKEQCMYQVRFTPSFSNNCDRRFERYSHKIVFDILKTNLYLRTLKAWSIWSLFSTIVAFAAGNKWSNPYDCWFLSWSIRCYDCRIRSEELRLSPTTIAKWSHEIER